MLFAIQIYTTLDTKNSDSVLWTTLSSVVVRLTGPAKGKAAPLLRGVEAQHELTVSHEEWLRFADPLLPSSTQDFEQVSQQLLAAAKARAVRQRETTAAASDHERAAGNQTAEQAERARILAAERTRRKEKKPSRGMESGNKTMLLDLERENVEKGQHVRAAEKRHSEAQASKEQSEHEEVDLPNSNPNPNPDTTMTRLGSSQSPTPDCKARWIV